jgi:DNA-binding transcriptional ArsR family regulator
MEGVGSPRRPATEDEARAMASGLRLRILRLCRDGALTNKEIAARLGKDPATVLYHVRRLVNTGFLVAEPVRRGTRGSRERPYRATGKSWILEVVDDRARRMQGAAVFDASVAEAREADLGRALLTRLGLRLTPDDRAELSRRMFELLDEFVQRDPAPDAETWAMFVMLHPETRTVADAGPDAGPAETAMPSETSRDTIEDDD